jgi:hypothetical protein
VRLYRTIPGRMKPRAIAPVLLCLVAHALLVSITHHHGFKAGSDQSSIVVSASETGDRGAGSMSGDGSDCLSCSLQRNFVSDLQPFAVAYESLPGSETTEIRSTSRLPNGPSLTTSDRAPPAPSH